ncbi:hypothetical protein [Phenylobacterium montanum]|uniref:Uncharacterized protein n=1 Tax=Phenylobacterium montanum TaxID=2823693 RepID=A0A975IVM5_9CAUL|nr:hypothetical protein [Caulobacter sp. S6]QUD89162.1 hypothetical protein KCG34_04560 [Caulobacter sp. S6]
MSSIFSRLAGAVTASLCLLAAPALAAVPLKWAPPALVNPVVITIGSGFFHARVATNQDCVLRWPSTKHVGTVWIEGCHNLVSMGGYNTVPPAKLSSGAVDTSNNANSRILYLSATTGVAHIEGLLGDASGGAMSDGIDINAPQATVEIENVRIDGIYGYNDQFHADCIQPFGGVKALRVDHFTCNTAYQGLSIWPVSTSPVGWTADIENTNVTSIGTQIWGSHNNGGYLYWPCASYSCSNMALTSFKNVYLKPRPTNSFAMTVYSTSPGVLIHPPVVSGASISFPQLPVISGVTYGVPPVGDFVPVSVAGLHYVSTGYGL